MAELYGESGPSNNFTRDGFRYIACTKGVTEAGELELQMDARSEAAPYLVDKAQLTLLRRWPEMGIEWYEFFTGILRDDVLETEDTGAPILTVRSYGPLHMLGWRSTLYPAGTANKTTWTSKPVETIVKDIVKWNFTASATTGNGRDRNGVSSGKVNGYTWTVETDAAQGTVMDFSAARQNCLSAIQDALATAGTGDIIVAQTGPSTFQFRYENLYGTDRSASVVFSLDMENITNPRLARQRSIEQTAIVVAGGGQKSKRAIVTRTGSTFNASTNDIEYVANGATTTGGSTSTSVLNAIGDKEKTKRRMRAELSYEILQTPATLLDVQYFLGDLVTVEYADTSFLQQIASVSTSWAAGKLEGLQIGTREYGA